MKSCRTLAAMIVPLCCVTLTAANAEMNWPRIAAAIELDRTQVHELVDAESRMLDGIHRIERAFQAHEIDRAGAGELVRGVRVDFDQAWQEILTDEQQQRWHQLHRRAAEVAQPPRDVAPLWRRIAAVVDVTPDQAHELEVAEGAFHQRLLRIDNAARDGGLTREEAQHHLETARIELNQALLDILNERQIHRIRESRVYDGNLGGGGDVAPMLLSLVGEPSQVTAVLDLSWGRVKDESIRDAY